MSKQESIDKSSNQAKMKLLQQEQLANDLAKSMKITEYSKKYKVIKATPTLKISSTKPEKLIEKESQNLQSTQSQLKAQKNILAKTKFPLKLQKVQSSAITLLKPRQIEKKIASIIVSFCHVTSYDKIFKQVEQKSEEGTQVLVYLCSSSYLTTILSAFKGEPTDPTCNKLMEYLDEVPTQNVVFNWQCCSGYTYKKFDQGNDKIFNFLEIIIQKGYMAMFSDFSLKALIANWPQNYSLGPNPFIQMQSIPSKKINLAFDKETLKNCPSAQLSAVGQISSSNQCSIGILEKTICYTVDKNKLDHQKYSLQILTIIPSIKISQQHLKCQIGNKSGAAGHVLLTFPSKGKLLVSMGHWIQLVHIQTTQQALFNAYQSSLGTAQRQKLEIYYSSLVNEEKKKQYLLKSSQNYIKSQAPCSSKIFDIKKSQ